MSDDITALLSGWPTPDLAATAITTPTELLAVGGDVNRVSRVASISKLFVALTALVAIEEGTISLDEPAGPPTSTVRHLLAHASGLAFDEHEPIAAVGARRIYSNAGIEVFADHLAAAACIPYTAYQEEAVIRPLGLTSTHLAGSPAHDVFSSVDDLVRLGRELLSPTLVHRSSLANAVTPQYPRLRGVVPGLGSFDPNPWGLGIEVRGHKTPHWTAPANSPSTYGHFGGTGTFLWVDPDVELACIAVSGTDFGPWALEDWPLLSQALLDRYS